jgi:hypothetical protein
VSAPDEKKSLAALKAVQSLSKLEFDALLDAEIGQPMLGVMKAVAKAQHGDDEEAVARTLHMLAFGYLLRVRSSSS